MRLEDSPLVYFLQAKGRDCVKIGKSTYANLKNRIKTIQYHNPFSPPCKMILLGIVDDPKGKYEKWFHRQLGKHHIKVDRQEVQGATEWFRLCDEVNEYIEDYADPKDNKHAKSFEKCHTTSKVRGKVAKLYLDEDTYSLYGKEAERLNTSASALIKKAMAAFVPTVKKMKEAV